MFSKYKHKNDLRIEYNFFIQISCIVNTTDYYACSDGSCSVTEYHKRGTFLVRFYHSFISCLSRFSLMYRGIYLG